MVQIVTGNNSGTVLGDIKIPSGNFDDRPIILGADSHVSEPINLGGEPEAPGDRFGTSSSVEPEPPVWPKPENTKLNEAIDNRIKLYNEYNSYEAKTDKTYAAKDAAKADMEAKRAAMQEAKNLRDEAKKAVEEAKKIVSNPSSTEEAGKALGDAKIVLDAANTKYKNAVKSYNASVKTFNKYIKLCMKRSEKLVSLVKSFNKAEEKVAKLGGIKYNEQPLDYSDWFKRSKESLKAEKVATGMSKFGKYAKTGGKVGLIVSACVGATLLIAEAASMIHGGNKFGECTKDFAKELGLNLDTKPSEAVNDSQTVVSNPSVDDVGGDTNVETTVENSDNTQKVDNTGTVADENISETNEVDNPDAAEQAQGTSTSSGASAVNDTPAEEVDEAKVEEEIAKDESEVLVEVREGDNLWKICKKELTDKNGAKPTNAQIAARVGEVMEKNGLHYEADGYRVLIYPKQKIKM